MRTSVFCALSLAAAISSTGCSSSSDDLGVGFDAGVDTSADSGCTGG